MELHEKLKSIRMSLGINRTEVEKRSGISYSCIKELENGNSNPTLFTLEVLCDFYGVKLWEVLNPNLELDNKYLQ
jgi:Predicted transcriptional regulator with C-terminal CBS domains